MRPVGLKSLHLTLQLLGKSPAECQVSKVAGFTFFLHIYIYIHVSCDMWLCICVLQKKKKEGEKHFQSHRTTNSALCSRISRRTDGHSGLIMQTVQKARDWLINFNCERKETVRREHECMYIWRLVSRVCGNSGMCWTSVFLRGVLMNRARPCCCHLGPVRIVWSVWWIFSPSQGQS